MGLGLQIGGPLVGQLGGQLGGAQLLGASLDAQAGTVAAPADVQPQLPALPALPALGMVGPQAEDLGVDAKACQMLRTLPAANQQEIPDLLSQGLLAGNISNPSGFVVKKVMTVTPKHNIQSESDVSAL